MTGDFDVPVNWDDVPDSDLLPDSNYELIIMKAEAGWTKTNKLAAELTYQVGAGELEGSRMRPETFTLGSEQDSQGQLPETKKALFGWMNLKRLANATGIRFEQSLKETLKQLEGKRFVGTVKIQIQADKNKDGSPNQYAGNQQNRITAYYPLGSSPHATAPQALAQGRATNGHSPASPTPQPQRRMTAAEALAQSQAGAVSTTPDSDDSDIPF
jgi:hypothetical protein